MTSSEGIREGKQVPARYLHVSRLHWPMKGCAAMETGRVAQNVQFCEFGVSVSAGWAFPSALWVTIQHSWLPWQLKPERWNIGMRQ